MYLSLSGLQNIQCIFHLTLILTKDVSTHRLDSGLQDCERLVVLHFLLHAAVHVHTGHPTSMTDFNNTFNIFVIYIHRHCSAHIG